MMLAKLVASLVESVMVVLVIAALANWFGDPPGSGPRAKGA